MKMHTWNAVQLAGHCEKIGSGATPRGGDSVYVNAGVALIRSQNVLNGSFAVGGLAYIDDDHAEQLKGVTVKSGDLLLNITGDSVARCCRVPDEVLPSRVNQHVAIIRPNSLSFDARYVAHFFVSPYMQATMLSLAGNGGTRKALTKEMIGKFDVPQPPLRVQQRIADILSTYDILIENNRRRMALLEESARQLYREWFVRLRFPGHEHTPIVDGVPKGWERASLKEVCREVREIVSPESMEPDTPYIGLEHIPRRSISLGDWGSADQVSSSKHRFRVGDILFGKIRPYFHKVGVAFIDGVASSDAIVIRPVDELLHAFVLMTVSSDEFVADTAQSMKEGSKMPRADWKQMQAYSVVLPPAALLSTFEGMVQPIVTQLKTLTFVSRKLRTARDLLLPRLMSGELAV